MFTGLVEAVGRVRAARKIGNEMDLEVDLGGEDPRDEIGASIALAGVCCTVVRRSGTVALFRLSAETLDRTCLGGLRPGAELNVERALRVGDPLGGHLVQGHVDGVGELVSPVDGRTGGEWQVRVPQGLAKYCVEKGSISLDGVSLTIARIEGDLVTIAVIPHTAAVTTIGRKARGAAVHVEVDVLAKYVEKQLAGRT